MHYLLLHLLMSLFNFSIAFFFLLSFTNFKESIYLGLVSHLDSQNRNSLAILFTYCSLILLYLLFIKRYHHFCSLWELSNNYFLSPWACSDPLWVRILAKIIPQLSPARLWNRYNLILFRRFKYLDEPSSH